jgi:hypothetical protein
MKVRANEATAAIQARAGGAEGSLSLAEPSHTEGGLSLSTDSPEGRLSEVIEAESEA